MDATVSVMDLDVPGVVSMRVHGADVGAWCDAGTCADMCRRAPWKYVTVGGRAWAKADVCMTPGAVE